MGAEKPIINAICEVCGNNFSYQRKSWTQIRKTCGPVCSRDLYNRMPSCKSSTSFAASRVLQKMIRNQSKMN